MSLNGHSLKFIKLKTVCQYDMIRYLNRIEFYSEFCSTYRIRISLQNLQRPNSNNQRGNDIHIGLYINHKFTITF